MNETKLACYGVPPCTSTKLCLQQTCCVRAWWLRPRDSSTADPIVGSIPPGVVNVGQWDCSLLKQWVYVVHSDDLTNNMCATVRTWLKWFMVIHPTIGVLKKWVSKSVPQCLEKTIPFEKGNHGTCNLTMAQYGGFLEWGYPKMVGL